MMHTHSIISRMALAVYTRKFVQTLSHVMMLCVHFVLQHFSNPTDGLEEKNEAKNISFDKKNTS